MVWKDGMETNYKPTTQNPKPVKLAVKDGPPTPTVVKYPMRHFLPTIWWL